jgi:hypothetical protein
MNEDYLSMLKEKKILVIKKVVGYGPSKAGKVVVNRFVEGIKKRLLEEETSGRRCYLRGCCWMDNIDVPRYCQEKNDRKNVMVEVLNQ